MNLVLGGVAIIAIAVFIVLLGVAAIAMVARSRGRHGTSGTLSSAALEIQSLLEPEKKRAAETIHARDESEDEDVGLQSPPR
jgi:hypothetical protein